MQTGIKAIKASFGDMSGGIANAYPAHSIAKNQVADAINALFEKKGHTKHSGLVGLDNHITPIRGSFCYKKQDGTELNIVVSDFKIYSVVLATSTFTQIGTLTSDTECFAINVRGKLWICNGVDFVKIESTPAIYRVGIAAPTGFTAAASGGGALAAGTYQVYASYSRIVGSAVLHSAPQTVNTALVVGATGTVTLTVTASADPQVTKITVWMTDANGSTLYYYGNANNTTGTVVINSDANKNSSLLMYEQAAGNQLPQAFKNIWSADGRIMGCVANSNIIYYSMKAQNEFDLERWPTEYYIPTIPYNVLSGYVLNGDLFINTVGGLYKIANCDLASKPIEVIPGSMCNTNVLYFPYYNLRSVVEYNGALWGFTNDGFRIFNGQTFSIDLSKHIKPFVNKLMSGSSNFMPAGLVYRRSGKRTEYRCSYNDTEYSTVSSNRSLVLNLDTIIIADNSEYLAAWELSSVGWHSAFVNGVGNVIIAQNNATVGIVAQETGSFYKNCLDEKGILLTEETGIKVYVKSRTFLDELYGLDRWFKMYLLRKTSSQVNVNLIIEDNNLYNFNASFKQTGGNKNILDSNPPLTIPFILSSDYSEELFNKMPQNAKGNTMAIEIQQTAIDEVYTITDIELYGQHEGNLFT